MLLAWWLGCTGAEDDSTPEVTVPTATPCVDAPGATWTSFGDAFFAFYCRGCHAAETPERNGAPVGVDFDTLEEVAAQADRIRVRVLDEETMPVGGGVYPDDLVLLDVFLSCGLPPGSTDPAR